MNSNSTKILARNVLLFLVGGLLFPSCSFGLATEVTDLRVVSVEVASQNQIPKPDKFWDPGVITVPLFRVTFTTKVDLEKLARDENYNIDNVTSICRGLSVDPDRALSGFPSVLDAAGRVDAFRRTGSVHKDRSNFEYHIYFELKQSGVHGFYSYDLIREPADICIAVNGAQELGFRITKRFRSNTMILPKEMISSAIIKAKRK